MEDVILENGNPTVIENLPEYTILEATDITPANEMIVTPYSEDQQGDQSHTSEYREPWTSVALPTKNIYSCTVCEKVFPHLSRLNSHLKTHARTFSCTQCSYSCSRKDNLLKHMRTHIASPYFCDLCDYSCARKDNLKVHIRIHTGEKPYSCQHCGKSFAHKSDLNKHTRTHT